MKGGKNKQLMLLIILYRLAWEAERTKGMAGGASLGAYLSLGSGCSW